MHLPGCLQHLRGSKRYINLSRSGDSLHTISVSGVVREPRVVSARNLWRPTWASSVTECGLPWWQPLGLYIAGWKPRWELRSRLAREQWRIGVRPTREQRIESTSHTRAILRLQGIARTSLHPECACFPPPPPPPPPPATALPQPLTAGRGWSSHSTHVYSGFADPASEPMCRIRGLQPQLPSVLGEGT